MNGETMAKYTERTTCRSCGRELPKENILNIGNQEIVDFLTPGAAGRGAAPLQLVMCTEKFCHLVQLRHTVDPDTLFRTFWYRSGINEQMVRALKEVVTDAQRHVQLDKGDFVGDIGSNDGTLLAQYPKWVHRVGFEPATALAHESIDRLKDAKIIPDYFTAFNAMKATHGKRNFKILTAIAMFYDLDNPLAFLKDVFNVLDDNGVFVVQMNYLALMVRNLTFDNIGHEHLCYYSLASLRSLFWRARLQIIDAETNDVNGGSLRIYAKKALNGVHSEEVIDMLIGQEHDLCSFQAMRGFAERVNQIAKQVHSFLSMLKRQGRKVYAYGASTRGSTLLQTIFEMQGLKSSDWILGVAERDNNKIGLVTAGTNLPIVSEEEARVKADYFLLLPYHFWPSIVGREAKWIEGGGKFVIPLPYPRVVLIPGTQAEGHKGVPQTIDLAKAAEMSQQW